MTPATVVRLGSAVLAGALGCVVAMAVFDGVAMLLLAVGAALIALGVIVVTRRERVSRPVDQAEETPRSVGIAILRSEDGDV